jgi:hypothetical protein
VLERTVRRMEKHLRRRGLLVEEHGTDPDAEGGGDPESNRRVRRLGPGASCRPAVAARPSAPRVPRPLLRQAAVRLARWGHLACRHARGCARPRGTRGALALCAASSSGTGARGSSPRRLGAHHAQEAVRRRDGRGRHGPAVPALPLGDERPPTALAHREIRGSARGGELVEIAHRSEASPADPGERGAADATARRRIPPVGAASGAYIRGGRPRLSQVPRGARDCSPWSPTPRVSPATSRP